LIRHYSFRLFDFFTLFAFDFALYSEALPLRGPYFDISFRDTIGRSAAFASLSADAPSLRLSTPDACFAIALQMPH